MGAAASEFDVSPYRSLFGQKAMTVLFLIFWILCIKVKGNASPYRVFVLLLSVT